MLVDYLRQGVVAGTVGGIAYGLFIAFVANPFIGFVETFEHAHGEPAVSGAVAAATSVVGGVVFGLLVGAIVFGGVHYFLEPLIPGASDTRSYLLAVAGFVTGFGAPWVALPPQPPGVTNALGTDVRIAVYVAMMVVGALVCLGAGYAYRRVRSHGRLPAVTAGAFVLGLLPVAALLASANPTTGAVPARVVAVFRGVVVLGHVVLWGTIASTHAWLLRRARTPRDDPSDPDADHAVTVLRAD